MNARLSIVGAAAVIVADQLTKQWVRADVAVGSTRELIPGFAELVHTENTGVSFGLLSGSSPWLVGLVSSVSLIVVVGLIARSLPSGAATVASALIVGGALGNLIDRIVRGGVTDFLDLPLVPPCNVADVAITVGAAVMVGALLFTHDENRGDNDTVASDQTGSAV